MSEEIISIPKWKMIKIEDTLRLAHNIHHSHTKETCFDRCVCKAWEFAKEALNNDTDDRLLESFDISIRGMNNLRACDFKYVSDLKGITIEKLLEKGLTKKTIEEVVYFLKLINNGTSSS